MFLYLFSGAFQNPPKHIGKKSIILKFSNNQFSFPTLARLFKEVIAQQFNNVFKCIVFAIIDDHNSRKAHNPMGNVQPFATVFETDILNFEQLREKFSQ